LKIPIFCFCSGQEIFLKRKIMLKKDKELDIQDWGIVGYDKALLRQKLLAKSRLDEKIIDQLVLLEHHSVVSIGRSAKPNDFKISKEELNSKKHCYH